ncbi:hypothetical protein [Nocardiopsis synnemataformans]|uniref:hypothetical protein n=1 Tax=Nocardiopsis synnemataformans TaxID=61305 RepID=UPI003EBC7D28
MAFPVVLHADAELVAITWLRSRLGDTVGMVCSELPGPDAFEGFLPIVQVVRLPSPPSDRRVHDIARVQVIVRVDESTSRPGAIDLAGYVAAHFAALSGQTITLPATEYTPGGSVTVGCIRRQSNPDPHRDDNTNLLALAFTGELYLRPFRVT